MASTPTTAAAPAEGHTAVARALRAALRKPATAARARAQQPLLSLTLAALLGRLGK